MYPSTFFAGRPKKNLGTPQDDSAPDDVGRYSQAISGMDEPSAPQWESVSPPNIDMTANLATPQSLDRDRLRQAFDSPPQFQRRDVGLGQRLASQFFGRFTKPIEEVNGVQDYRDALANYQTRTSGLQGAVGLDRQDEAAARQSSIDALSRENIESEIDLRKREPRTPAPIPGRDVPFSPEVLSQQEKIHAPKPVTPVPGRDVPFSPDVENQRTRMYQDQHPAKDPNAEKPLSSKDRLTVKGKLATIQIAKQQLAQIKEKFAGIKGSFSAGPGFTGQGMLPTESGKAFDAAVAPLTQTIIGLTRTPGIGSMSDYESRLAQAPIPSRSNYETVTEQQIKQIEDYINTLDTEYSSMGGQSSGAQQTNQGGPPGPASPGMKWQQNRRTGEYRQVPAQR